MKFSGNFALSLDAVTEFDLRQKKDVNQKLKEFCSLTRLKTKQRKEKVFTAIRYFIFGRNLGFICADRHFFV